MFMRENGDPSVWKSLAVAFGDGLAFGVGVKLSQNAPRYRSLPAPAVEPDGAILDRLGQLEDRINRIEGTPAPFDPQVLEALTAALDARLQEHVAHVESRVAEMEARLLLETRNLDQQDRTLASRAEQDIAALKNQVIAINREFAEQVGRIVSEQVAAQVQARTAEVEPALRAHAMDAVDDAVQERLAPMRAELARKDREIADLRERAAATESTVSGFILALGEMCRQAADRLTPPAAPGSGTAPPPAESAAPAAPPVPPGDDAAADLRAHFDPQHEPPSFSELRKPAGFWRMPMVSSLVVTAASLVMLRFF
jgi:hypothetical protein